MLISFYSTRPHNPFRMLSIRSIYIRSRFQTNVINTDPSSPSNSKSSTSISVSSTILAPIPPEPLKPEPSAHKPQPIQQQLQSQKQHTQQSLPLQKKSFYPTILPQPKNIENLQISILDKIHSIHLDKSNDANTDLDSINYKTITLPTLSEIDLHILKGSKTLAPCADHSGENSNRYKLINDKLYEFKYNLINNNNSIIEIEELSKLIYRLTYANYINQNEQIMSFIKQRIIYSPEGQILLKNNKSLYYCIIDFLMRNAKHSNLQVTDFVFKLIDNNWDTQLLNIYLRRSLGPCENPLLKLRLIDSVLTKFIINDLPMNKTTLYLIYKYISISNIATFQFLKYGLQDYFTKHNMVNNSYITTLVFEDLANTFRQIIKKNDFLSSVLTEDSIKSMSFLLNDEKFSTLDIKKDTYSTKSLRKVFRSTESKSLESFQSLIDTHLQVNQFQRSLDMVFQTSNYNKIYNGFIKKYEMSKLLNGPLGYKLTSHLSSISNWQLLIRTINEIKAKTQCDDRRLSWNIYDRAIKHLIDVNLEKSHLDQTSYVLLMKYLIHNSLDSDLGPFKRWDILFRNAQSKIDSIFNTNHSLDNNLSIWSDKLSLVRARRYDDNRFRLFNSLFDITECYDFSSTEEEISTPIKINDELNKLISSDLSIITDFESMIFKKLSTLRILNSKKKVSNEFKQFKKFYELKNIDQKDVFKQYHLGLINQNYKFNDLKWEKIQPKFYDSLVNIKIENNNDLFKLNALSRISDVIHENLTDLLNTTDDYQISYKKRSQHSKEFKQLDVKNTLNNVLPNDWIYMVVDKCHNDWLVAKITEKLNQ